MGPGAIDHQQLRKHCKKVGICKVKLVTGNYIHPSLERMSGVVSGMSRSLLTRSRLSFLPFFRPSFRCCVVLVIHYFLSYVLGSSVAPGHWPPCILPAGAPHLFPLLPPLPMLILQYRSACVEPPNPASKTSKGWMMTMPLYCARHHDHHLLGTSISLAFLICFWVCVCGWGSSTGPPRNA